MDRPDERPLRVLSSEELAAALRRVGSLCPICQGTVWDFQGSITTILPTQDSPDGLVQLSTEEEGHFRFRGIVAVPGICRECGFIAQFSYNHLSKNVQH